MPNQPDDEIPAGFAVPVSSNEIDGVDATRRPDAVDYVTPAIYTREQLRRDREDRDQ